MRLTVLGSSCSVPRPGRACSGYLVEQAGSHVILDFGTGVLSNLRLHRQLEEIEAIVVTHMHADHFLDLIPLRYALKYGHRENDRKVPVFLPPGGEALLRAMAAPLAGDAGQSFFAETFALASYDPVRSLRIGGLTLRFAPTAHPIPTFAVRCEGDEGSITYSADTAPCVAVEQLAQHTDIFICEATLIDTPPVDHCTPEDAGTMASHAEARRLVLTHYSSEIAKAQIRERARTAYAGPVSVADDHAIAIVGEQLD